MLLSPQEPLAEGAERVSWPPKVDLFGIGMTPTTYDEATEAILAAAARREPAVVACQAVHAVMTACGDPELKRRVNAFEMLTPDGQPVRWAMNLLHRTGLRERVYGPELTLRLCRAAAERGVSIYLYGGSPEVLEKLQASLALVVSGLADCGRRVAAVSAAFAGRRRGCHRTNQCQRRGPDVHRPGLPEAGSFRV